MNSNYLLLAATLLVPACSEDPGPKPSAGYSETVPNYSTPDDLVAQKLEVPMIDLAEGPEESPPLPVEVNATCGTILRLNGHLLRKTKVLHMNPMATAYQQRRDGKTVIASSASAEWTVHDGDSRRSDYVIDFPVPSNPGTFKLLITTFSRDPVTKQRSDTVITEYLLTATTN